MKKELYVIARNKPAGYKIIMEGQYGQTRKNT